MKNLYVGNLPHSTTEAELRTIFESHGPVEKITLVTDRDTGRSRGFGFVEMTNATEADKAIAALNGTDLGGRTLTINEAKPKTDLQRDYYARTAAKYDFFHDLARQQLPANRIREGWECERVDYHQMI